MPATPEQIRAFANAVRGMQNAALELSDVTRSRINRVVDDHRKTINDMIRRASRENGKELPAHETPKLSGLIRAESNEMAEELKLVIQDAQKDGMNLALTRAESMASAGGFEGLFFSPSADLVVIAGRYSAQLVSTITTDLMPKVDAILGRAALGGLTPFDAMGAIDTVIGKAGASGVSYQAERIVRTEVNRIYNVTLDTQIKALASKMPDKSALKKTWKSGPWRTGRRTEHQKMNGETVGFNEKFSNGLNFPGDPQGPAEEVINCGCGYVLDSESIMSAMGL